VILLLGTKNRGKIKELQQLLADLRSVKLVTYLDQPFRTVEESGKSFLENALIKARAVCAETGLPVLAEDAGLEVTALGGAPGIFSARFSGIPVSHEKNNALLLERLGGVKDRRACFVAIAAFRLPEGKEFTSEGRLWGTIATHPSGRGGFGYDPLFIPADFNCTLAELSLEKKNQISHRYIAIKGMNKILQDLAQKD